MKNLAVGLTKIKGPLRCGPNHPFTATSGFSSTTGPDGVSVDCDFGEKSVFLSSIFSSGSLSQRLRSSQNLWSPFLLCFSSLRGNCILGGKRMITWFFVNAFFFLEIWDPKFIYATNQLLLSTKKVYSFVANRKSDFLQPLNFIGCNLTVHV